MVIAVDEEKKEQSKDQELKEAANPNPNIVREPALQRILSYGLIRLPRDIGNALLIGILITGIITVLIPEGYLAAYFSGGILAILMMIVAGVPVYVCATASVPIAAGFIHMGVSPGAALAFLIAGPATNAAAFMTTWNFLGRRSAIIYLFAVVASAIGFGLLLDMIMPFFNTGVNTEIGHVHQEHSNLINNISAITLLLIVLYAFSGKWLNKFKKTEITSVKVEMTLPQDQQLNLNITGMTCSHCSDSVQRAVSNHKGVKSAMVSLEAGTARVTGENLERNKIVNIIKEIGYTVVD